MKEFQETNKVTYNLMSFTSFKALIIFSMLCDGPKSYDEIRSAIENNEYLNKEKFSIDTMRVYLNSLRRIGCEIKRVKGADKISRYVITSHPFELKLSEEQIKSAVKVYKSLVKKMNIKEILYMNKLFEKISAYINDENLTFTVKSVSMLRDVNCEILEKLIKCCDRKNEIVMKYRSPNSGDKDIKVLTKDIEISNGKIYLSGFGYEYKQNVKYPVSRILEIKEINESDLNEALKFKVVYELYSSKYTPKDDEEIIKQNEDKYVIEILSDNKFYVKQRLLEYGPAAKIIEPVEFKEEFVKLLNKMKAGYCG